MVYLLVREAQEDPWVRVEFRPHPERKLGPYGHAEICKTAFQLRGYSVEGPHEEKS